jgi:hypothetical protein
VSGFAVFIEPADGKQDDIVVGPFPRSASARKWARDNLGELRGRYWIPKMLSVEEATEGVKKFREANAP